MYKDIGVWDIITKQIETLGFTPVGYIWDGPHYRFVITGDGKDYVSGATIIASIGLNITSNMSTAEDCMYTDPLDDSLVKHVVKQIQQMSKKTIEKDTTVVNFLMKLRKS